MSPGPIIRRSMASGKKGGTVSQFFEMVRTEWSPAGIAKRPTMLAAATPLAGADRAAITRALRSLGAPGARPFERDAPTGERRVDGRLGLRARARCGNGGGGSTPLEHRFMSSARSNSDVSRPAIGRTAPFRAIGFSLIFNALCPYLLFRFLEPRFPAGSVLPLLYTTIFPIAGFLFGVLRKGTADAVALIVLAGIAIHLAFTIVSPDIGTALVLRSFQGAIIGSCFLLSAAIGRPVILYVARQFVTAGGPGRRERFDLAVADDRARTFTVVTVVWGVTYVTMSFVHAALALRLAPDQFVLISPIIGLATDLLLLGWSIRYTFRRMSIYMSTPA